MEKINVLGTGHALTLDCFNTCFTLSEGREHFLVDAGGGNGVLRQLRALGIGPENIHNAFLSHCHTDHLLGMIWVLRVVGSCMHWRDYPGEFRLFCHQELAETVRGICAQTLPRAVDALFGKRLHIVPVEDGESVEVMGHIFTFFDTDSRKERQFGFSMREPGASGRKLTFLGDEPFQERSAPQVQGSDWLLGEAFCLYAEREIFRPYDFHHSTVREACELAERFQVPNLVLWHARDKNLSERKAAYLAEGRSFYSGNLYAPDDLDVIDL
ncbi:MBL fold metallo-hydrolase [Desulfovibrio sp. OttesenSCG-928-C14]|nr:MBL fold metallo-hydrolase [Desulfovibrio sp. OttesenSCG-928-C14]